MKQGHLFDQEQGTGIAKKCEGREFCLVIYSKIGRRRTRGRRTSSLKRKNVPA